MQGLKNLKVMPKKLDKFVADVKTAKQSIIRNLKVARSNIYWFIVFLTLIYFINLTYTVFIIRYL